jgi:hypothetical protein
MIQTEGVVPRYLYLEIENKAFKHRLRTTAVVAIQTVQVVFRC